MNDKVNNISEERIAEILQKSGVRPVPDPAMMESVRANVRAVWQEEVSLQKQQSPRLRYALVASVVMAAGAGLFVANQPEEVAWGTVARVVNTVEYRVGDDVWQPWHQQPLTGHVSLRTAADSYASLRLESGMEIRLNEKSQISLEDTESLHLTAGQVYVDSNDEDGVDKSIRIDTSFGSARDIGTRFAVEVDRDGWTVRVREGKVSLNDSGQNLLAAAGEAISVDRKDAVRKSPLAPYDASWTWVAEAASPFAIEGKTLQEYLSWVSKESGHQIEYTSAEIRDASGTTILHGDISGLRPLDSLPAVVSTTGHEYVINEEGVIVLR
ncbi:MAG: FecR domain-containing protein [Pseudomonadales bacterium]|nr:FecR domain-containing protein [Pseudomonadales bacterium]